MGLNEREINEFMIYWLPELNENEYNFIYFRINDVNKYMPLNINYSPDTIIRIYMDYKKASKSQKNTPQELPHVERKGFTIVEWGERNLMKGLIK